MAQDVIKIIDIDDQYDYITMPFPSAFTEGMDRVIVNEMTTMSGETVGQFLGRKRNDVTLEWSALDPQVFIELRDFLATRYEVDLDYPEIPDGAGHGGPAAWVRSLSYDKMRYKHNGMFVCERVRLTLSFPGIF